jgi:hypothetical protein
MLATDSVDQSVKHFSFLTDSIDHRSGKKNFSSIKSTIGLRFFFLLKIINLKMFFTVDRLSVSIQSMFFLPSVPIYASGQAGCPLIPLSVTGLMYPNAGEASLFIFG